MSKNEYDAKYVKEHYKQIMFKLRYDSELYERLQYVIQTTHKTVSDVIKEALTEWLDKREY